MSPVSYRQYESVQTFEQHPALPAQETLLRQPPRHHSPVWILLLLTMLPMAVMLYGLLISPTNDYEQTVTLHMENARLKQIFKLIEQQTSYHFCYTEEQMSISRPVTMDVSEEKISRVLQSCFRGQPFTYVLVDTVVVVQTVRKKQ